MSRVALAKNYGGVGVALNGLGLLYFVRRPIPLW